MLHPNSMLKFENFLKLIFIYLLININDALNVEMMSKSNAKLIDNLQSIRSIQEDPLRNAGNY